MPMAGSRIAMSSEMIEPVKPTISEKTITAAEEKMVFKLPRQLTE